MRVMREVKRKGTVNISRATMSTKMLSTYTYKGSL
jgi:hypothetical protein